MLLVANQRRKVLSSLLPSQISALNVQIQVPHGDGHFQYEQNQHHLSKIPIIPRGWQVLIKMFLWMFPYFMTFHILV